MCIATERGFRYAFRKDERSGNFYTTKKRGLARASESPEEKKLIIDRGVKSYLRRRKEKTYPVGSKTPSDYLTSGKEEDPEPRYPVSQRKGRRTQRTLREFNNTSSEHSALNRGNAGPSLRQKGMVPRNSRREEGGEVGVVRGRESFSFSRQRRSPVRGRRGKERVQLKALTGKRELVHGRGVALISGEGSSPFKYKGQMEGAGRAY